MINALIFRLPSNPSTESMKIKVTTYAIRIKLDYNKYLHNLIDKWLTQSIERICNSLDTFNSVTD